MKWGGSAARGGRKEIWFALLANFSGRYGVCSSQDLVQRL